MKDDAPSETALRSALRRAAHQIWDDPKIFVDPLALRIVGPEQEAILRRGKPAGQSEIARTIRAFMVARSRFAEDALAQAVARGVDQYVVMGAGLDTFAFRNPYAQLRVYEIDHPATQAGKRERLAQAAIDVPASATFAPVDFAKESLAEGLSRTDWDAGRPTFFSWLGVTSYLTPAAVMSTLGFVAARPRGSEIVFDVSTPASHVSLLEKLARAAVAIRITLSGEPAGTRFDPERLAAQLRALGFSSVEATQGTQLNALYFAGRTDALRVSNRAAVLRAAV
jgi:methyltransferase (TIGR00027 family)